MPNFIEITLSYTLPTWNELAFFRNILGFETLYRVANYAYVHRETTGFRILEQTGPEAAAPPGNRRF